MARKGQGIGIIDGLQGEFGAKEFLHELVQRTVQQVSEAERTSFHGAGMYERNGERRGWRNGYKPRTLKTRVGTIDLMIPNVSLTYYLLLLCTDLVQSDTLPLTTILIACMASVQYADPVRLDLNSVEQGKD